jgi:hypothetical protein
MCASCGCGVPEDTHGDERNITWSQVQAAAQASNTTPAQVAQNIQGRGEQAGVSATSGQVHHPTPGRCLPWGGLEKLLHADAPGKRSRGTG